MFEIGPVPPVMGLLYSDPGVKGDPEVSQTFAPPAAGISPLRTAAPRQMSAPARVVDAAVPHGGLLCDDECQYCWGPETD